jgi:hypothetical protein
MKQWLNFVDDSLKTHPHNLWEYVSNFKRKNSPFTLHKVDNQFATDSEKKTPTPLRSIQNNCNTNCRSVTFLIQLCQTFTSCCTELGYQVRQTFQIRWIRWNSIVHY